MGSSVPWPHLDTDQGIELLQFPKLLCSQAGLLDFGLALLCSPVQGVLNLPEILPVLAVPEV